MGCSLNHPAMGVRPWPWKPFPCPRRLGDRNPARWPGWAAGGSTGAGGRAEHVHRSGAREVQNSAGWFSPRKSTTWGIFLGKMLYVCCWFRKQIYGAMVLEPWIFESQRAAIQSGALVENLPNKNGMMTGGTLIFGNPIYGYGNRATGVRDRDPSLPIPEVYKTGSRPKAIWESWGRTYIYTVMAQLTV